MLQVAFALLVGSTLAVWAQIDPYPRNLLQLVKARIAWACCINTTSSNEKFGKTLRGKLPTEAWMHPVTRKVALAEVGGCPSFATAPGLH